MAEAATKGLTPHARLALALLIVFSILGFYWYGFDEETRGRIWDQLIARPTEKMKFRFLLQPVMSGLAAFRDARRDAKLSRAPYFWSLLTNPSDRIERLSEGLVATARVILLGLVMDIIYQWLVLGTFYPGEAVIVALALAFVPYLLLRGPFGRLARIWVKPNGG
jgi:hypothetical protein